MNAKITTICLLVSLLLVGNVSATSAVYVQASSDGGEFNFIGDGGTTEWNMSTDTAWDISVEGFDIANVDIANDWMMHSHVRYEDIGDGEIFVRVNHYDRGDEFYYFAEKKEIIDGNGNYTKGLPGGHSVQVANSTNITGYIDYRVRDHKATFLRDTSHHHADLTVIVHNGHLLENASVELLNGPQEVAWTDEDGVAELTPTQGKYAMLIEAEGFNAMLVDDLTFENSKHYLIRVNMTDCLASCGIPVCGPDADDLIMYYKEKRPANNPISPQGYVNYFAKRLTTCMAGRDKCASGTLERFATTWGIYPNPELGVLLYDCNFTKGECDDEACEWNVTYTVKNYQKDAYNYTVSLIAGNTTTEMNTGLLGPTFSSTAKETLHETIIVDGDYESGCCGTMYLAVISEEVV